MLPLQGKSAVVTGAASGIGKALTLALLKQGATVFATDNNPQGLQALLSAQQPDFGDNLHTVCLDVTDEKAVQSLLDSVVTRHGTLDYLFNNAGIVVSGHFEDMNKAVWQKIIDINLWGVIHGVEHGYRIMLKQGHGHIINTASTAGITPVADSIPYSATKHAVVGLSTSLREQARYHNIRVSVVIPGLVDTAIFSSATTVNNYDYLGTIQRVPFRKISPDQAAQEILRGVMKNQGFIVFPAYNKLLVMLYRLLPESIGRLINRTTTERTK
jgi:NAD(P)-dependent dehydrogenase (short-subunit alcohol dehydrogenase family)